MTVYALSLACIKTQSQNIWLAHVKTQVPTSGLANIIYPFSLPLISQKIKNCFVFSFVILQNTPPDIELIVKDGFQDFGNWKAPKGSFSLTLSFYRLPTKA